MLQRLIFAYTRARISNDPQAIATAEHGLRSFAHTQPIIARDRAHTLRLQVVHQMEYAKAIGDVERRCQMVYDAQTWANIASIIDPDADPKPVK